MPDNLQVNSTTDQGSAEHEDASNVPIYDAQANLHRSSQFGLPYGGLYPHYMQMHGNPSLMYTPGFYGDERYSNSMDFSNGFRRKNATKETTSALKAWLIEHKKNPYPTKGEKIMLAILTRMTLTQISTWFANARRRLKKENKMTWSPRTCCGKNDEDCRSRKAVADSSGQSSRPTGSRRSPCDSDDDSDDDDRGDKKNPGSSKSVGKRPIENAQNNGALDKKKPKIWSIAETVASTVSRKNPIAPLSTSASVVSHTAPFHLVFPPWPRMAAVPLTSSSQQSSFLFRPELLFQNLTDVFAMQANRKDENVSKTSASSHVSSTTMITKDLEPTSSSTSR